MKTEQNFMDNRKDWVPKILEHALANYEKGWDRIYETYYTDVMELLTDNVSNFDDAIKQLQSIVDTWNNREF
jgi:hypothetical protein